MGQGWEEGVREPLSQERALHQSGQKSADLGSNPGLVTQTDFLT